MKNPLKKMLRGAALALLGVAGVTALYGGAEKKWHQTTIRVAVQDAKRDATPHVRTLLLAKSRHFAQNGGLVTALSNLFEQYTVGRGLLILPDSTDAEWNKRAAAALAKRDASLLVDSRSGFRESHGIDAWELFNAGEFFLLKVALPGGRIGVQRVECHRCFTPPGLSGKKEIQDGIEIDKNGKPVAYYFANGADGNEYRRVEAEHVEHCYLSDRPGQYRGLPILYSVIDTLHDLSDLELFEMQAAKDAGRTSKVVENDEGTAPGSPYDAAQENFKTEADITEYLTQHGTASEPIEGLTPQAYYQKVFGAETVYIRRGDTYKQAENNRPSAATSGYWDKLIEKICGAAGINVSILYPQKASGPLVRAYLEAASSMFRAYSETIARSYIQIYKWVLEDEIRINPELKNPPADWDKFKSRPPRSITVDRGYASTAKINEYKEGFLTLDDICAEEGRDWREQSLQYYNEKEFRDKLEAERINKAKKLAEQYGFPVEWILFPTGKTPQSANENDGENDENNKRKNKNNSENNNA